MSATASKNASELDLDAYRKRNETEREWQLRKLFIERFQSEFEHDRLLCLAQCYVNIKTLGCRYSDRIMNQIKSLTVDFDPIVDERIEPIIKEMREKNPPQQNHSKQKQEKQAKNSPKPQQQQQQQQNQPKQKLISKTQFVLGSPLKSTPETNVNSNVAATVTNPVQILARPQQQQQPQSQPQQIIQQSPKQSQPPQQQQQQQQQQPSTPNSKKLGQTAAIATAQSQNLLGKSPAASSGVPVMTGSGEAAPNPALLPIPFGLQSSSSPSMSGGKPAVRNALLAQFSSSSSTSSSSPANPFAILTAGVAGGAAAVSVPLPPLVDDQNFRRLARVNKLRDVLRDDQPQLHVDENFDWSAYIEQKCASVGVNIAYNQFEYKAESTNSVYNPDGCALYYGELILESFRVTTNESKKRKKCKSGAFKHAYEILTSKSELAVKQVSAATRRSALLVPSVGKQQSLPIVDFDYELYSLDGSGDASHRRIESVSKNLSTSLPTTTTTTTATATNVISNQDLSNMMSIDQMLKMMILPKDNNKAAATTSMDVTVEEKKTPNDADDDDDENRSQGSDKKSKIKQNLPNFILFIPSSSMNSEEMTLANFDKFLHERNSINVLQNSCAKCKYGFELETKEKKAKSTSSKDNGSNGKNNASVDQAESDEHDSQNNDGSRIKCKCLINGVKIATASAKNKYDAKRLAALKALKYLFKTFPVFKETSYQSIINNPTNNNSTAAANDATATETSKNALMASLGITPQAQAQPQTTPQYYKISKEDLFGGLIPPTMFEKSSCGAAAVAVASSQQQLAQTNPSAASSSFGLKMLMKMGWRGDGHGLGKNQQGVAKPIQLDNTVNRFGLGYDEYAQEMAEIDQIESISMMSLDKDKDDVKQEVKKEAPKTEAVKQPVVRKPRKVDLINNIRKILIHFANSPSDNDLLFDKSLSAEDRKLIHQEAHKLGLKTRSEGSDQNRFIVVRKNINTSEIIDAAMRNGGQVSRYQVVSKGAV